MTRGKYAAKAANRTANLDNELLQEKIAEVAELKRQLAERDATIELERTQRTSEVLARADELSAKRVAEANDELQNVIAVSTSDRQFLAKWIAQYVKGMGERNPEIEAIPEDLEPLLARLVGRRDGAALYANMLSSASPGIGARRYRRGGARNFGTRDFGELEAVKLGLPTLPILRQGVHD